MEKVIILKVYNLLDSKGTKLQLRFGVIDNFSPSYHGERGYRWSFLGTKIPMPVRNGTWFNGFPEPIMLEWLKENGWHVQTIVDMSTGKANVFELPNGDEGYKLSELAIRQGEDALESAIRMLCDQGLKLKAIALYRYVHHCTLSEGKAAVDAIQFNAN